MTKKTIIIIILIASLAAFLRFYNLPALASFTFDEEHQFGLARTLIKNFHIIWIGVSASNLNFYLGPFWVYFTYIWLKIGGPDPLLSFYISSAIGVITAVLLFYAGKKIFDTKTAAVAALLYAVLPLIVYHNQKFWNVTIVPFLSLLMFYSLYQALKSPKWWILFFAAFGLVFHTHLSLVPLGLIGSFLFLKNRSKIKRKILIAVLVIFFMILSPLIAFDHFHNWSNTKAILQPKGILSNQVNPVSHISYLMEFLGRIWYLKPNLAIEDEIPFVCKDAYKNNLPAGYDFDSIRTKPFFLLSAGSFLLLLLFLFKPSTWKNLNTRLLAVSLLSIFGFFVFFPIGPSEYYLIGVFPLFLLLCGLLVKSVPPNLSFLFYGCIAVISLLGINTVLHSNLKYGLGVKKQLIGETMKKVGDAPFELYQNGICHSYDGWRYLFMIYGRKPERSDTDAALGWLYPEEVTKTPAKYKVIMSEAKVLPKEDISKATIIEGGGFKAYIIDENSIP